MKIFLIDAFTDIPFKGNPAYVCIVENEFPSDQIMQRIAYELKMSETVFVRKNIGGFDIRWFTPECEVPLCGHGTLAASFVIFNVYSDLNDVINFNSRSGILKAKKSGQTITLDFPLKKVEQIDVNAAFIEILGAVPDEVHEGEDLFICYFKDIELEDVEPDFIKMKNMTLKDVIITTQSKDKKFDFVSRVFAPGCGIDEDPVTGSAHCALAPFWAKILSKNNLNAKQLSERSGILFLEINKDRLFITGDCVNILSGDLKI